MSSSNCCSQSSKTTLAYLVGGVGSFLIVGALAWFWLDSLKAREAGIREAREACAADGLQLLDDTVAGRGLRLRTAPHEPAHPPYRHQHRWR